VTIISVKGILVIHVPKETSATQATATHTTKSVLADHSDKVAVPTLTVMVLLVTVTSAAITAQLVLPVLNVTQLTATLITIPVPMEALDQAAAPALTANQVLNVTLATPAYET
jgi:hypothetical protein